MRNALIAILILVSGNVFAVCHDLTKTTNGTPVPGGGYTYRDVDETILENGTLVLNCDVPGLDECKFSDGFPVPKLIIGGIEKDFYEALADAEAQIAAGVQMGTVLGDEGGSYSWSVISPSQYTFSMCD